MVDRAAGRVCSHIRIQYRGSPESFAWVIPVPAVPEVADSDDTVFTSLDAAAALTVVPPNYDYSASPYTGSSSDDGSGCGPSCNVDKKMSADLGDLGVDDYAGNGPVTVYAQTRTESYEVTVVGSETTAALVQWLRDNGYNYSDNMEPALRAYVAEGSKFAAFKLRADRETTDVAPVVLCYDAQAPSIPLRLTAVAAQPYLGLQVDILADRTYGAANAAVQTPDGAEIVYDPNTGYTNYFEWVARAVAEGGGHRLVVEYAGAHGQTFSLPGGDHTAADFPWLTRFYTRISPEQMDQDPSFVEGAGNVSGLIDLSGQPPMDGCSAVLPSPAACWDDYCGLGSTCLASPEGTTAYCQCTANQVAVSVRGPDGNGRATCAPAVSPLGITDEAAGVGSTLDPCMDYACGAGLCRQKNGFPACICEPGAAATVDATGLLGLARVGLRRGRGTPT